MTLNMHIIFPILLKFKSKLVGKQRVSSGGVLNKNFDKITFGLETIILASQMIY